MPPQHRHLYVTHSSFCSKETRIDIICTSITHVCTSLRTLRAPALWCHLSLQTGSWQAQMKQGKDRKKYLNKVGWCVWNWRIWRAKSSGHLVQARAEKVCRLVSLFKRLDCDWLKSVHNFHCACMYITLTTMQTSSYILFLLRAH